MPRRRKKDNRIKLGEVIQWKEQEYKVICFIASGDKMLWCWYVDREAENIF